ncbi:MAG: TIGR03936 family radical SAM-associated protein [Acidimicrobiales bacterium]
MTPPDRNRRVRFRFTKVGKVRFTSHRDVARLWERALRRAELPVALTEGFSPRPKVHFGLALPTGYESDGEYLDVDLRRPEAEALDLAELPERLSPLLPPGLDVVAAADVDPRADSLQQAVTSCTWRIEAMGLLPVAAASEVARVLASEVVTVVRQRKGKDLTDDIRPDILDVQVVGPLLAADGTNGHDGADLGAVLVAELATQPRGLRPSELLSAFAPAPEEGLVRRTHQWISVDGARHEPLVSDATWADPPVVQAS